MKYNVVSPKIKLYILRGRPTDKQISNSSSNYTLNRAQKLLAIAKENAFEEMYEHIYNYDMPENRSV